MHDRIREVRNDLKLTQTEFAEATGKTKPIIVNYELDRVVPDDSFLQLLALKFNYRIEWLRTGEMPKRTPEPEADQIAAIGLKAAHLDEAAVRKRVHELVDDLPTSQLKLLAAIWQSEEFRKLWER